ncbi:MAG: beta-lactamase family protein [Burkholderiaceae bacterium]|nr:beta-lactamase family protein [Burkholderiaceae bacterium]
MTRLTHLRALFSCLILALTACANASTAASKSIDAALRSTVNTPGHKLAGLAALAIDHDQVVYEGYFGFRSDVLKKPLNAESLMRVASISKLVTAIGVMQLVEGGKLNLDADIGDYLGYKLRNPSFPDQPITLRDLLSHTSSLRDPSDAVSFEVNEPLNEALYRPAIVDGRAVSYWADAADQDPRAHFFKYANVNLVVVATLIEKASGERFDRYIRGHVLQPLGVPGGFYPAEDLSSADFENLTTLYRKSPDSGVHWQSQGPWVPQGPDRTGEAPKQIAGIADYRLGVNAGVFKPQGGLRTNLRGLARIARLFNHKGSLDGVTILQPATVEQMLTAQWQFNGNVPAPNGDTYDQSMFAWGLGVQLYTDRGGKAKYGDRMGDPTHGFTGAGHPGDAYGLLATLAFDAANNRALIYVITGEGSDPGKYWGHYSSFCRWEERILSILYQRSLKSSKKFQS